MGDDPVEWDARTRRFVARPAGAATPAAPRQYKVGPDAVGRKLPPQPGSPRARAATAPAAPAPASVVRDAPASAYGSGVMSSGAASTAAGAAAAGTAVAAARAGSAYVEARGTTPVGARLPGAASPTAAPGPAPAPKTLRKLPRVLPHRPKLRTVLFLLPILLPLLVVASLLVGFLVAKSKFDNLHRVPVAAALDSGGSGTNILLVGSDTRENLAGISPQAKGGIYGTAPGEAPTGQRSDTMMILRLDSSGARILSVPRDLIVQIAGSSQRSRINSAYNTDLGGGPVRLIQTIQANLNIPINRYMEVDFGTFGGVVDALGGIELTFSHMTRDTVTGLAIGRAGKVKLNGEQALQYVRSRHYEEYSKGRWREDPTADLGRIKRQQLFLETVMGTIGRSRNPFTLLKVAGALAKGLRVDDELGFMDAVRLGWDLKGMHPVAVELPVLSNNDRATLRLDQPKATQVLEQFGVRRKT